MVLRIGTAYSVFHNVFQEKELDKPNSTLSGYHHSTCNTASAELT